MDDPLAGIPESSPTLAVPAAPPAPTRITAANLEDVSSGKVRIRTADAAADAAQRAAEQRAAARRAEAMGQLTEQESDDIASGKTKVHLPPPFLK